MTGINEMRELQAQQKASNLSWQRSLLKISGSKESDLQKLLFRFRVVCFAAFLSKAFNIVDNDGTFFGNLAETSA